MSESPYNRLFQICLNVGMDHCEAGQLLAEVIEDGIPHNIPIQEPETWDYELVADKDTVCGQKGIKHRMKRYNCYDTSCINEECDHWI